MSSPSKKSQNRSKSAMKMTTQKRPKAEIIQEKLAEIKAAKEELKREAKRQRAELRKEKNKERNGQLIAFGLWVEFFFASASPKDLENSTNSMKKYLTGRTLTRALAGIERLRNEVEIENTI
jgi:hypothetical protein